MSLRAAWAAFRNPELVRIGRGYLAVEADLKESGNSILLSYRDGQTLRHRVEMPAPTALALLRWRKGLDDPQGTLLGGARQR